VKTFDVRISFVDIEIIVGRTPGIEIFLFQNKLGPKRIVTLSRNSDSFEIFRNIDIQNVRIPEQTALKQFRPQFAETF
jgi:hypothetical protein